MQVDFETAKRLFETAFGENLRSAYLHPYYVAADAKRETDLTPVYFVHSEDGETFYYAFHLGNVPGSDCHDIQSQYGYGGPISTTQDGEFLRRAWATFDDWCKDRAILAEFVRFHPLIENNRFFLGETSLDRDTVWIDLSAHDLLGSYSTRARTAIRKARKEGLQIEWWDREAFFPMFRELYREHMQFLNADRQYFFCDAYMHELVSWKTAQLGVCTLRGEVLAAAIFLQGPMLIEYHLSATKPRGKSLSATNLLIHEAAEHGQVQGCQKLNLGGGTDATPDNSLLFFKSGFSELKAPFYIGKRIRLPEEYLDMKASWEKQNHRLAHRLLFYR